MIVGVIFSFFFLVNAFAQSSDDWYYDKEIVDIDFIGLSSVNSVDIMGVVSEFLGKPFTDAIYAEILNRIYSLEYFADIIPSAKPADALRQTVALEFEVTERPVIRELLFSGNKEVRTTDLRSAVSSKENAIYMPNTVIVDERQIRNLYFEKGFTNIRVSSETVENDDGVQVTFFINEGRSTVIDTIAFQGNKIATEQALKKLLEQKEVGLFQKGIFQETTLEQDKQAVLLFYQTKGYIDAVIEDVVREVTYNEEKNRDELTLTYIINEGSQYFFNGITVEGNVVFSSDELLKLVNLKTGDVFNQVRFQEGLMAIADLYYENGYTSNGFYPEMNESSQSNLISCRLIIVEQPRSHIESIRIVGNEKTKDYVLLREIPLETGDIFSKTKLETGLRSLYNLAFFSAIVPEIVQGSEENLIDIVLNVQEQSTVSLEFGVTFSGVTDPEAWPVSVFTTWSDNNFLGTGRGISAGITGSNEEQSLSFNYTDPWFLNMPLTFSAGAFVNHLASSTYYNMYGSSVNTTTYLMDYNQLSFGFNGALGKRFVWDFGVLTVLGGLSTEFIQNFYDAALYEPVDTVISDRYGKFGVENSVWTKASLDARDLYYDPSKGWFASQQFTWTGLIPELESEYYLRTDTKGEIYFTLLDLPVSEIWNLKFVLAGYTGLSFLFPVNNSTISTTNKLSIDGMFNGRGWGQSGGGDQSYDVTGDALWSSFIELRFPVAPGILSLDFFMDAVAITDTPGELFTDLSLNDFYFSFGPGLRFSIPQFPLRLLWAWSFKYNNGIFEWNTADKNKGTFVLSFNLTNQ